MFGLFRKKEPPVANEQAVLVAIKLTDEAFGTEAEREGLFAVEERIIKHLGDRAEFDGNEFGDGFCTLYIYCGDARTVAEGLLPLLKAEAFPAGSYMIARSGPPGSPETRTALA